MPDDLKSCIDTLTFSYEKSEICFVSLNYRLKKLCFPSACEQSAHDDPKGRKGKTYAAFDDFVAFSNKNQQFLNSIEFNQRDLQSSIQMAI